MEMNEFKKIEKGIAGAANMTVEKSSNISKINCRPKFEGR
jgi:hypothetical protein